MTSLGKFSVLVATVSDLSELVPLVIWFRYGIRQGAYGILGMFFLISALLKLVTLITAELVIPNMPVYHVLACFQIIMVYLFYARLRNDQVNMYLIGALLAFNLLNSFWLQNLQEFNSIAWSVNMLVMLVICLLYLFRIYNNDSDQTPLEKRPDFTITAGWLIYGAGSLFTYVMASEILGEAPVELFNNAWLVESVSNIIKNIIISYGIWQTRKVSLS